ncbi:ADP-ribosylglycohydrolase family protein [Candidatus Falkowbacteria bacterium]|nr:ADP-ribosylglycohydrolase family protein [Candidatus Falkowbacteria bacterium]MBT7348974.1 ADP-ribosylglycohydrolase family protein [Candidatus Falkowbacteria bacterium]MBT7500299.1 ADP-ribosylglycohydrolase family protein [Candidatus Falkowbacteria bacterium]
MQDLNELFRSKVQACFLGVAIGDAMGMPVETMTDDQIEKAVPGGVTGFLDAKQTRFDSISNFKAGETTDDWQLTRALAKSLIRCKGYDFEDMLKEQIREANESTAGWGGSTRNSIFQIQRFFQTDGREGKDPRNHSNRPAPNQGCGNGVAMKIAPLAMYVALANGGVTGGKMMSICVEQGMATHSDIRASIAAYAICWLMSSSVKDEMDVGSRKVDLKFKALVKTVRAAEKLYSAYHDYTDKISDRLQKIHENGLLSNLNGLIQQNGCSCYSLESIPFAIAIFFRNPTNFRAGVLEAVNAGGDTDTNAAIVGALIGANVGLESIPVEWQEFNRTFRDAKALGVEFFDTFAGRK